MVGSPKAGSVQAVTRTVFADLPLLGDPDTPTPLFLRHHTVS